MLTRLVKKAIAEIKYRNVKDILRVVPKGDFKSYIYVRVSVSNSEHWRKFV